MKQLCMSAGMPPTLNEYDTAAAAETDALANKWHIADPLRTGCAFPKEPMAATVAAWPPTHVAAFLGRLLQFAGVSALKKSTTRKMNEVYGFDAVRNPEVRSNLSSNVRSSVKRVRMPCSAPCQCQLPAEQFHKVVVRAGSTRAKVNELALERRVRYHRLKCSVSVHWFNILSVQRLSTKYGTMHRAHWLDVQLSS